MICLVCPEDRAVGYLRERYLAGMVHLLAEGGIDEHPHEIGLDWEPPPPTDWWPVTLAPRRLRDELSVPRALCSPET